MVTELPVAASRDLLQRSHSDFCYGHWRCDQTVGSGNVVDVSGNGNDLVLGSALVDDGSGVWGANAGSLTLPGDLTGGTAKPDSSAIVASAYPSVAWGGVTLIAGCWVSQAAGDHTSGNAADLYGCGGASVQAGWRVTLANTGALDFVIHDGSTAYSGAGGGNIDDGNWHFVCVVYDSTTDLYWIYVDLEPVVIAIDVSGAAAALAASTLGPFALGTNMTAAGAFAAPAQYRDAFVYHVDGSVSANLSDLLRILRRKYVPLTDADFAAGA